MKTNHFLLIFVAVLVVGYLYIKKHGLPTMTAGTQGNNGI